MRKVVHIAMGGFALLLRTLTPLQAAALAAGAVLFNLFALHPLTGGRLLRAGERRHSVASGIVLYPLSVLGLVLAFQRSMHIAAGAWGLLAVGDGMATVIGRAAGGRRLPWNADKSWAGLAAFVGFGAPAAAFLVEWVRPDSVRNSWQLGGGCIAAALLAGFAESFRSRVDDNVVVPAVGAAVLYAAFLVDPALLAAAAPQLGWSLILGSVVNVAIAALALVLGGVRLSGAFAGFLLGTALYTFAGAAGFVELVAFFALGTLATRLGYARKAAAGIAQARGGRRGAREALANVSAALCFGFLAASTVHGPLFRIAMVAALATAAADTVSSEIGQAFGRRHYLATTFRPVPAGTDGAVSWEGTLAGVAASILMAGLAFAMGLVGPSGAAIVVLAAFVGTTFESLLGATVERTLGLGNEIVNFANTLVGGFCAAFVARLAGIA